MDTCTNCGASLRPGAKFCTTCGTRLNEVPASDNAGWGTPAAQFLDATQETGVIEAVKPDESPSINGGKSSSADSWSNAYGDSSASSTDPASRFRTALDGEVQPVEDDSSTPKSEPESTWTSPSPSFTPPPASNWSYSAGSEAEPKDEDTSPPAGWGTPANWESSETAAEVDAAGFTEDGDDEVDALSGDENIELSGKKDVELPPDEARDKAIALADELRRTIRMMSSGGESDHGAAIMALTEASLNFGDYSDIRGVISDVKNDPRDIQSLSALAGKVDRVEALLDDYVSLSETIETAIKELNG